MYTVRFFCLLLIIVVFSLIRLYPDIQDIQIKTKYAIELINNFDFKTADELTNDLLKKYPEKVYPYFLLSYKFFWRFILTAYDTRKTDEFLNSIKKTFTACKNSLYSKEEDTLLFKACSYLFLSFILNDRKDNLGAFINLQKGIQTAQQLKKQYPENADIALIFGCYYYYKPFRNSQYLMELEKASLNGFYFSALSAFMNGKFLQDENTEWQKTLVMFKKIYEKYPGNSILLFHLAKSYQHSGDYKRSIDCYKALLEEISLNPQPVELLCRVYFSLGQIFENNLYDFKSAIENYYKAVKYADPEIKKTIWFIPWGNLHIGRCFLKIGNHDLAYFYLEKVKREDDKKAYELAEKEIKRVKKAR